MIASGNTFKGHLLYVTWAGSRLVSNGGYRWLQRIGFSWSFCGCCLVTAVDMVILGRILVFFGLVAILHAGYSAVQCEYFLFQWRVKLNMRWYGFWYWNPVSDKVRGEACGEFFSILSKFWFPFRVINASAVFILGGQNDWPPTVQFYWTWWSFSDQPEIALFVFVWIYSGRTYYKLLEEEFPGLPPDVSWIQSLI